MDLLRPSGEAMVKAVKIPGWNEGVQMATILCMEEEEATAWGTITGRITGMLSEHQFELAAQVVIWGDQKTCNIASWRIFFFP